MNEKIIITSNYNKITTTILIILVLILAGAGYFIYKDITEKNEKLQNDLIESKQLTESLIRSSSSWATKDDLLNVLENNLTKEELRIIKEDLSKLGANLNSVGVTIAKINNKIVKMESSDSEDPPNEDPVICENTGELIDVHKYTLNPQNKIIKDINDSDVAKVKFNASSEKPWSYEVYERKYYLTTTIGKNKNGQNVYYHDLKYSTTGEKYGVNILSSNYLQLVEKENSWFLNPRLDLNVFGGTKLYKMNYGLGRDSVLSFGADVGISFWSYGKNKVDSIFRIVRIGVGYDAERRALRGSISPITFNVGKPLPLFTNLYLAPQLGIDTAGGLTLTLGVGPQF